MKRYLLFFSLLASFEMCAQYTPIPIGIPYEIPKVGHRVLIELKSSKLESMYEGTELFEIYGPNDVAIGSDYIELCRFDQCFDGQSARTIEHGLSFPSGNLNGGEEELTPEFTLGLRIKKKIPQGQYTLVVRDPVNQKVLHRRLLTLINPEPMVSDLTVFYPDGTISNDVIALDVNKDFKGIRFYFRGENLDNEFESITVQGLSLVKHPSDSGVYLTGEDWIPDNLKKISIEDPKITFARHHVNNTYSKRVAIKVGSPAINGSLVRQINAGQDQYALTLQVSNLFSRAQLKISELDGQDVLKLDGTFDGAKVDLDKGTITQQIQFNGEALNSGNIRFGVQVINRDEGKSEVRTVQIQVQEESVMASPVSDKKPFVSGVPVQVKFTRSENSPVFQFDGDVILSFDDQLVSLEPRNLDGAFNQFFAEVSFLEGSDAEMPFELQNANHVWRGYFRNIMDAPQVVDESTAVYAGSSFSLRLDRKSSDVKAVINSEKGGVKLLDSDFTDAFVEIQVDKVVPVGTEFSVDLYYYDHVIETVDFQVISWRQPQSITQFQIGKMTYPVNETDKLILNDDSPIVLKSKKKVSSKEYSQLTVQLVNSDGIKLGTPQPLIYDEKSKIAKTKLTPRGFGISGGEEFMIELVNPMSQPILQPVYVKRRWQERFTVNAGVSAVNVFFKDRFDEDGNELPRTSLISGVNLGCFYLFETLQTEGKRPFGAGLNLMAQQENGEVGVRYGMSFLLFETLSIGISGGGGNAAFFLGANIGFLDFSRIFDN